MRVTVATMSQPDMFGPLLSEYKINLKVQAQVGTHCKACGQWCKVYRNKFNSSMARTLIWLYPHFKKHPLKWLHVGKYLIDNYQRLPGVHGKLCVFEMMEKNKDAEPLTGAKSAGLYRMTGKGILFVENRITVPGYWTQYNGDVIGFDGDDIGIRDALGKHFDYAELMREVGYWKQGELI